MTPPIDLTAEQAAFLESPALGSSLLTGSFGSGKTTAAALRVLKLSKQSKDSLKSVLVLVPQYRLASQYQSTWSLHSDEIPNASLMTFSSLIRRNLNLFWPLVSEAAGFADPMAAPKFLTVETAQYYMAQVVDPLMDKGMFAGVNLTRNRIYGQLLDNLNKSAIIPFPLDLIASRLKSAWSGRSEQLLIYDEVQHCLQAFRKKCLEENLLDYSLQVEIFRDQLWTQALFQRYFISSHSHLVYDNLEEEPPFIHDLLQSLIPNLTSATLIIDENAGFRKFLGADPASADRFKSLCQNRFHFDQNLVNSAEIATVKSYFLNQEGLDKPISKEVYAVFQQPDEIPVFVPELLDWVVEKIQTLIDSGTNPSQIAILSPYLSSTLAFFLEEKLKPFGLRARVTKASALLKEDPLNKLFLDGYLLCLNSPQFLLSREDFVDLVYLSLGKISRIEASLLADAVYGDSVSISSLPDLDTLEILDTERISQGVLERYKLMRTWLQAFEAETGLSVFISRFFGELLTQAGFGMESNLVAGQTASRTIDSYKRFSEGLPAGFDEVQKAVAFIQTVRKGLLSGFDYLNYAPETAVLITPALNFMMANEAVEYQFWLNTGDSGWYERLEQPLTQAYVLSRQWQAGKLWTSQEEADAAKETLQKIVYGLLSRCTKGVFLGISTFNETGNQDSGLLLQRLQGLYRKAFNEAKHD